MKIASEDIMLDWLRERWERWRQIWQVKRRLRRLGCLVDRSREENVSASSLTWTPRQCDQCGDKLYYILWPEGFRRSPERQFGYFRYCLLCGASAYPNEENLQLVLEELESGSRPAIH